MNVDALYSNAFITFQVIKNDQAILFRVKEQRVKFAVNQK